MNLGNGSSGLSFVIMQKFEVTFLADLGELTIGHRSYDARIVCVSACSLRGANFSTVTLKRDTSY